MELKRWYCVDGKMRGWAHVLVQVGDVHDPAGEKTYCDSDEHSKWTKHLDSFVDFLSVTHGWKYTNPAFDFCPWCGKPIYAPTAVNEKLLKEVKNDS